MERIDLTKEEFKRIYFLLDTIGVGTFGLVKKVDDDTCIKLYYKDFINTYSTGNFDLLDHEIDIARETYEDLEDMAIRVVDTKAIHNNEKAKLELLNKLGIVKRLLYYRGYLVGIEVKYYKDYINMFDAKAKFDNETYQKLLDSLKVRLEDLMRMNIFPKSLDQCNVLVNPETLDIAFTSLDSAWTRYDTDEYLNSHPRVKESLINTCYTRFNEIADPYRFAI